MATTDDLNKSTSEMSDEELLTLLRRVRASRRTHKNVGSKPAPRQKTKIPVGALTSVQRQELIEELEGMLK